MTHFVSLVISLIDHPWASLTATIFKIKIYRAVCYFSFWQNHSGHFPRILSGVKTGKSCSGYVRVISVWTILSNHFSKKMFLVYGFGDVA